MLVLGLGFRCQLVSKWRDVGTLHMNVTDFLASVLRCTMAPTHQVRAVYSSHIVGCIITLMSCNQSGPMAGVCLSAQDMRVEWSTEFCSEVSIALWCAVLSGSRTQSEGNGSLVVNTLIILLKYIHTA